MLAVAENTDITLPDWVYDCAEDPTKQRRFWITKGLGAGGTHGAALWHVILAELNKKSPSSWVVAPTYAQIRDPIIPSFVNALQVVLGYEQNRDYQIMRSGTPRIELRTGHSIYFKSANRPEMFVGANISHATMTEPGIIDRMAYDKTSDRIRCPKAKRLQFMLEGTPEGVGNWYEEHANIPYEFDYEKNYRRITLWTEDNIHLDGYADQVRRIHGHDKAKLESYLYGRFVPLVKGNAYHEWSDRKIKLDLKASTLLPLIMGWDFQVAPLSWVAWQQQPTRTRLGLEKRVFRALGESSGEAKGTMNACVEFALQFPPKDFERTQILLHGGHDGHSDHLDQDACYFETIKKHLRNLGYKNVSIEAPKKAPGLQDRYEQINKLMAYDVIEVAAWCRKLISSFQSTCFKAGTFKPVKNSDPLKDTTQYGDAGSYPLYEITKDMDFENLNPGKTRSILTQI